MKILLNGVARSGTTFLYDFTKIINYNNLNFDYVFEPFNWDYLKFNDLYEKNNHLMDSVENISTEGIYFHKKLPIFYNEDIKTGQEYVNKLLNFGENTLIKSVRSSGRYDYFLNEIVIQK